MGKVLLSFFGLVFLFTCQLQSLSFILKRQNEPDLANTYGCVLE